MWLGVLNPNPVLSFKLVPHLKKSFFWPKQEFLTKKTGNFIFHIDLPTDDITFNERSILKSS